MIKSSWNEEDTNVAIRSILNDSKNRALLFVYGDPNGIGAIMSNIIIDGQANEKLINILKNTLKEIENFNKNL